MLLNQKSLYCLTKGYMQDKPLEKNPHFLTPKINRTMLKPISIQNIEETSEKNKTNKQLKSEYLIKKKQSSDNHLPLSVQTQDYKEFTKNNEKGLRDTDDSYRLPKKKQTTIQDFKCIRQLGRGRHGKVFLVIHRETGFIGAMKIFSKQDFRKEPQAKRNKMESQLIKELKLQSYLIHSNIIKVYSIFSDKSFFYLFMELGSDGQLFQILQRKITLKEDTISFIFRSLLAAVQNLHEKNIIHRDLKPENIVLIHGFPKICDFGQSSICIKQKGELRQTLCGTPLYLSPQMLQGERYNEKIDIWALGAMAYELFTGDNPFNVKNKEQLQKIVTESFEMKSGSLELCNFITFCLKKNPMERPSASKLLKHPFIKKYIELQTIEELCH